MNTFHDKEENYNQFLKKGKLLSFASTIFQTVKQCQKKKKGVTKLIELEIVNFN